MTPADVSTDLVLDVGAVPPPDSAAEPSGFLVEVDDGTRIHLLDWGAESGRDGAPTAALPGVVLLHGLAQTAWAWTPVARRLRSVARVIAVDLRGHGLSDSPTEGYDGGTLAGDVQAVAEAAGLTDAGPIVIAGHGFGAIVAAWAAQAMADAVGALILVDGGWERIAETAGVDEAEFLRGLDEPPEILRSMTAFLGDRRDWDPATWDADQEQAARATVVEAHSKRLNPATRPHAVAGSVDAMFAYDPLAVLPALAATIAVLRAADDEAGNHAASLEVAAQAVRSAGRPPMRIAAFPDAGHNLMRYRPREVAAAILAAAGTLRR